MPGDTPVGGDDGLVVPGPATILVVRPEDFPHPKLRHRARRQFRQVVRGGVVRPHVQAFADACKAAGVASSFGTYPGHQPELALAIDIFHPLGDRAMARRICDFAFQWWEPSGVDYAISFNQIWNPERGRYWRPHAGGPTPTARHEDHVHLSFEPTGQIITRPGPPPPAPTPPDPWDDLFPVLADD